MTTLIANILYFFSCLRYRTYGAKYGHETVIFSVGILHDPQYSYPDVTAYEYGFYIVVFSFNLEIFYYHKL